MKPGPVGPFVAPEERREFRRGPEALGLPEHEEETKPHPYESDGVSCRRCNWLAHHPIHRQRKGNEGGGH